MLSLELATLQDIREELGRRELDYILISIDRSFMQRSDVLAAGDCDHVIAWLERIVKDLKINRGEM